MFSPPRINHAPSHNQQSTHSPLIERRRCRSLRVLSAIKFLCLCSHIHFFFSIPKWKVIPLQTSEHQTGAMAPECGVGVGVFDLHRSNQRWFAGSLYWKNKISMYSRAYDWRSFIGCHGFLYTGYERESDSVNGRWMLLHWLEREYMFRKRRNRGRGPARDWDSGRHGRFCKFSFMVHYIRPVPPSHAS
jgi:hypothetical protein